MSVNKVILIGRLGADPELRAVGDTHVANFSIATNEKWTDKAGEKQERTEWHRVAVWGKSAENAAKYLAKGREVYIEGKIQTHSYEKDGTTRYATDIKADKVVFIGGKPKEETTTQTDFVPPTDKEGEVPPF